MTKAAQTDVDFKAVGRRFLMLNDARLARTREVLSDRQQEFFDLLPLLLHVNHPMLPGYVASSTPSGVFGYQPPKATVDMARRLARSYEYRRKGSDPVNILSLFLMGSPGTVAYSERSDFDIWLCHDPTLGEPALAQLQQKTAVLEKWAASLDLEVHFFPINPERLRNGELQHLSDESSGTAQFTLLVEEFYRTALLLAGQPPLWWLVPPEREADYEEYVADLKRKRFIHARDHLDLGGLAQVPAEEFFGAALWQLYKGIDSPYKAALKLLLIESYAADYPEIDLLGVRFKKAVYTGEEDLDRLDPYLMMLEKVEEYLRTRDEPQRIELARRCFYFKADQHLSRPPSGRAPAWQRELLSSLAASWGWRRAELLVMDSRESWKINRVSEERRLLFEALSASYRFLSDFARRFAGLSLISRRDLTTLGRKLYAAFERKSGKLELINRGVQADLHESHLTFQEVLDERLKSSWQLHRGSPASEYAAGQSTIKRGRSLVELIAWAYFNGLLDKRTVVMLQANKSQVTQPEFTALVGHLHQLFPLSLLDADSMEDFAGPARVLQAGLFVNVAVDLFSARNLGRAMAGGRADALSYGGGSDNLARELDLILLTSWREVLVFHFSGAKGLLDCLCEYLKWAPPGRGEAPPRLQVHGPGANKGRSAARRLDELVHDLAAALYGGTPQARYIFSVGRSYYALRLEGDTPRYRALDGYPALLRYLATPQAAFTPTVIDRYALANQPMSAIYSVNRSGYVQFFYRTRENEVDVYVLDERGSLFHQTTPYFDTASLLGQYSRFFEAVLNRINFLMQEGQAVSGPEGLEFYRIDHGEGGFTLERQPPQFRRLGTEYLSLQVIVEAAAQGGTELTAYCDDREFTTLEHGTGLFDAVVGHVLGRRRSGQNYPVYITDIGLSRAVLGEEGLGRIQTVHFLNYKRSIEQQLNSAMGRGG